MTPVKRTYRGEVILVSLRSVITLCVAVAAASLSPMLAAHEAASHYILTDVGTLGGARSEAHAINERGEVAGWAETATGLRQGFLYRDRKLIGLDSLPAFAESEAFGMNDRGQVVGAAIGDHITRVADTGQFLGKRRIRRAVVWTRGSAREIGPGEARDINNSGQVVYQSGPSGSGFLWEDGKKPARLTDELGRATTRVHAIADSGTVVGEFSRDGDRAPFTWIRGRFTLLAAPVRGPYHAEARSINREGHVAGVGADKDGEACLWAHGRATFLGTRNGAFEVGALGQHAGFHHSAAYGINDRGQIVGTANASDRGLGDIRAILWHAGKLCDLNDLIDEKSGWLLEEARAINGRGLICGSGSLNGRRRAFLLTPRQ